MNCVQSGFGPGACASGSSAQLGLPGPNYRLTATFFHWSEDDAILMRTLRKSTKGLMIPLELDMAIKPHERYNSARNQGARLIERCAADTEA